VSDYDEIRNLIGRYCQLVDDNQTAAWAELFTPDAVMHVPGRVYSGRDAIRAFIESQPARGVPAAERGKHMNCNTVIELDGDGIHARAWTDYMVVGRPKLLLGRYDDTLVRDADGWRLVERKVVRPSDEPG
jgi:uncharacterized protein (TIGR02246 family)